MLSAPSSGLTSRMCATRPSMGPKPPVEKLRMTGHRVSTSRRIDVAFAQVVLAACFDERPVHGIDAVHALVVEERGHRHVERAGDFRKRLQMRRALTALDHGEERDAD